VAVPLFSVLNLDTRPGFGFDVEIGPEAGWSGQCYFLFDSVLEAFVLARA